MKREYTEAELAALRREALPYRGINLVELLTVPGHYRIGAKEIDFLADMVVKQRLYPEGAVVVDWLRQVADLVRREGG